MRHVYARGIIAMIWLIAASVSGASGKTADAVRYVILGGFFSIPPMQHGKVQKRQ